MAADVIVMPRRPWRARAGHVASEAAQYAALVVAAVIILGPIYVTVAYSLQPVEKIFTYPPHLIVTDPQWDTYRRAFEAGSLGRYLVNSLIVSSAITAGQVSTSIIAALSRASLGALSVFSFLMAWNQYLWPLLVTNKDDYRTVQIGLKALVSTNIDQFNVVMAGTVIAAAPIFALLLAFQKQLIRGLTAGAIKG